jgi:hypothetical protein
MKKFGIRWIAAMAVAAVFSAGLVRGANPPAAAFSQEYLEGRALANAIIAQKPGEGNNLTGALKIKDAKGKRSEIPIKFQTLVTSTNWQNVYLMHDAAKNRAALLTVIHAPNRPNLFVMATIAGTGGDEEVTQLEGNQAMIPFAGSDFWVIDLGLEFFHWPVQRVLKKEMKSSMACRVLESTNPNPAPGAYRRVISWVDVETLGIVKAEAYDANNKLMKTFTPKKFKKVSGRWQLKEMEMLNERTDSRTTITFDLPDE